MVEVFRTNVKQRDHANILISQIHKAFPDYKANFDLEDCDKILRVDCKGGLCVLCVAFGREGRKEARSAQSRN